MIPGGGLRNGAAVTVAATLAAALGQWLAQAGIGHLGGASSLGVFAWAAAVSTPWFVLTSLQLRTVLAGQEPDQASFAVLMRLRLACVAAVVLGVLLAVPLLAPRPWWGTAFALLALGATTWIADLIQGWLQVRGRVAAACAGQVLRPLLGAAGALALLWWRPALGAEGAAIALAVAGVLVLALVELPALLRLPAVSAAAPPPARGQLAWLATAFPLGLAAGLGALGVALPRLGLASWHAEAEVGAFAAMALLVTAASQLFGAPTILVIAALSARMRAGDVRGVAAIQTGLAAGALALGLSGIAAAHLVGRPVMTLLFGAEIGRTCTALPEMALVALIELLSFIPGYTLTAAGRFGVQVWPALLGAGLVAAAVWLLVPAGGQRGAAWALAAGGAARLLLMWWACRHRGLPLAGDRSRPR
jgi:O-antigen/teichoic acid export membrane protein